MIYLVIVNVAIALSFSLYHLFFRKLTFFQWNRFYLLGTVVVSLLIPIGLFIDLSTYFEDEIPTIHLADMMDIAVIQFSAKATPYYLVDILNSVYWAGVLVSLTYLLYKLCQLYRLFQKGDDYLSFSFFRKVFLGEKVSRHETILTHEQVHVQQGHSYDIVFVELVKVFNWFNPALYLVLKELKFQHECIADEACSTDKVAYAELLVAHAMKTEPIVLAHGFSNHSFLKKRIMMLFKNKSSQKHKLFYLCVLPFLLIVTGSTLLFNTSRAKEFVSSVEDRIQDVALPIKKESTFGSVASEEQQNEAKHVINPIQTTLDETSLSLLVQDTTKKTGRISKDAMSKSHVDQDGNLVFESVEVPPAPKGGMDLFRKWIADNYEFPAAAIDAGVKGTIVVTFIVEADGSFSDIRIQKDLGLGTGRATIDLIKKAKPWNPGIQNGRLVRVAYTLPIRLDMTKMRGNTTSMSGESKPGIDQDFDRLFEAVEVSPSPKGGMDEFRKWIADNYPYPAAAIDAGVKGTVTVGFVVEANGSLSDIKILKDLGHGTGEAAVKLMEKAARWNPGIQNGRTVRVLYTLPIRLDLTNM